MTNFKGTPLFGQDSSPRYTSDVLALIFTAVFWLIFLICMAVIKPAKKEPEFKEVQIVLSSTPVKKQEQSPAPSEAAPAASSSAEQPVQKTVAETPAQTVEPPAVEKTSVKQSEPPKPAKPKVETPPAKPKSEPSKPKTEPKKTQTSKAAAPAPAEPVEYALDPMEAFAQQTAKKPKQDFNWDMFDDEPAAQEESVSQQRKIDNTTPVMTGSAAKAAEQTSKKIQSSDSSSTSSNKSADKSTSKALASIANTSFSGKAVNGVSMQTNAKTATSGSGKVMMEMSNGSSRALLEPAKPIINLSEKATATIDGSRTVKIRLKVVESGNVPYGDITITPESILSDIVRTEIREQISQWRFEAADYTAFAEFEYKIVKQ